MASEDHMASREPSHAGGVKPSRERSRAATAAEYAAKGWPSVNPHSRDYCYQPCENGLHVCGEHPDGMNCLTVLNLPTRDAEAARELFERVRPECAVPAGEDFDLVVDLMTDGDCGTDFTIRRQMLDRLKALAAEAASPESGSTVVWPNHSPTPLSKTEVQS